MYFDDNGMVIATRDLQVAAGPYEVRESAKFKGRYYFFHKQDKTSAWALPPRSLGIEAPAPPSARAAGGHAFPPIKTSSSMDAGVRPAFSLIGSPHGTSQPGSSMFCSGVYREGRSSTNPNSPMGTSMDGISINPNTQAQRQGMFTTGASFDSQGSFAPSPAAVLLNGFLMK